ncbi:DUF6531 domain-containing protein [Streptomyces sp. MAR4 CNY-716]
MLDLDEDPTPGDPQRVKQLARELHDFADDVADALRQIKGMAGEDALLRWAGKTAKAFQDEFEEVPKNLKKLQRSYDLAGDALASYWPKLERAQSLADKALARGREARHELSSATGRLDSATSWVERATAKAEEYDEKEGKEKPDESEVRAATRNATDARSAQTSAQTAVDNAEAGLEAAKKMAADAKKMREDAASEAKEKLDDASDAGIQNRKWWEKAVDWVKDNWDTIVNVCKVIVAVLGIVVLIIGGPLAWVVLAAALVVLADTLVKYLNGEASLWDVAFAALDCIPGMKGLTSLAKIGKGLKGGLAAAKTGLKGMKAAVTGLGKALQKGSRKLKDLFTCNDPIDVATGELVASDTDVALPGVLTLLLQRHHRSGSATGRLLGSAWSSTLDQRLLLDADGVRLVCEDGMVLHYPVPEPDVPVLPVAGPRWPLSWDGAAGGLVSVEQREHEQTLRFRPLSEKAGELPLHEISDRNGNVVRVQYGDDGIPHEIVHSGGYRIGVTSHQGRITALTLLSDPEQPVLVGYGYDGDGNLVEILDAAGVPMRLGYDRERRIVGWEDRVGTRFSYTYDARGRCIRTHGSDGYFDGSFAYEEDGMTTVYTDSLGNETTFHLNESYQVIRETNARGAVTLNEWDPYNRLLSSKDPLGRTTSYQYDDGNISAVELPDGSRTTVTHNELGLPVEAVEPNGARWRRTYDEAGNLTALENPAGAVTRYTYDQRGALRSVTDPAEGKRSVETNAAGLPVRITDPLGGVTEYTRDSQGRVSAVTDPLGARTLFEWHHDGQMSRQTFPDGTTERRTYDPQGNLLEHVNGAGHSTRYRPTHFSLPTAITHPDGTQTSFTYDTELRLIEVKNARAENWTFEYDAVGNVLREEDFAGGVVTYEYDAADQPVLRTNGAGQTLRCAYDVRGRLVEQRTNDGSTTFQYDAAGHLLEATNSESALSYERDAVGTVLAETCNDRTLRLAYDQLGRRVSRRTPSGSVATWEYDANNQLTALRTAGRSIEFSYDAHGQETGRRLGPTALLSQTWDAANRMTEQAVHSEGGDGASRIRRSYVYRPDNLVSRIDDSRVGVRRFTLDAEGRITAARTGSWREEYAYDAVGNLVDSSVASRTEDRHERLSRTHCEYDAHGRVIRAVRRTLSGRREDWRYAWDAFDRLTDLVTPDGSRWHYVYDPLGRRIAKQLLDDDGAVVEQTDFVWEGTRLAEQQNHPHASGPTAVTWHWHPGAHRPLAQVEHLPEAPTVEDAVSEDLASEDLGTRFYAIVTDLVGTPTELIDDHGEIAWTRRTTVWGLPITEVDGVDCPLGFPGQYYDDESALFYNVRRYYDPRNARYLSPDPLGLDAGLNNHAYVRNPFVWSDPLGLICTDLGGWYSKLKPARSGNEINHIPAKSAYKHLDLSPSSGPSIRMDYADHRAVSSTGSSRSAKAWQRAQRDLIDQGRFDEAMKMDIDDIRARFGSKYDQHLADMVASMPDNKSLQKFLSDNNWSVNYDLLK